MVYTLVLETSAERHASSNLVIRTHRNENEMMFVFTVAVNYSTHDDLKNGLGEYGLQFAAVLAESDVEATLVAAQMVASHGVMPTRTTVLEVMEA
jgi:hypothetical protein